MPFVRFVDHVSLFWRLIAKRSTLPRIIPFCKTSLIIMSDIGKDVCAVLAKHPELRVAILFGSMATGRANRASDVDLAVAAEHPLTAEAKMALMAELAEATGRPIDLVDLHHVGTLLLGQIVKGGRRILGSDERYAELIKRHLFEETGLRAPYKSALISARILLRAERWPAAAGHSISYYSAPDCPAYHPARDSRRG